MRWLKMLLWFFLFGCYAPAPSQILPFDHYSLKQSLPSTWITSIFQDARGYLWIGGDEGVSAYDGIRFKNYGVVDGLPVNHVWSIYESRISPGTMWIGPHAANLAKFAQGRFTTMQLESKVANTVTGLIEDHEGVLWCATGRGVYRVHGNSAAFFPTGNDSGWAPIITQTRDSLI